MNEHTTSLKQLQSTYGLGTSVVFAVGRGELPSVVLTHSTGHTCEVALYGAHITDWRTPDGKELLFMSQRSAFDVGKPIRGGVPLVFPQFGLGALPAHGFVRTAFWEVERTVVRDNGDVEVVFAYEGAPGHEATWPHASRVEYVVTLNRTLQTRLIVTNRGDSPFQFQGAFHTYFHVEDVQSVRIAPFAGTTYLDSVQGRKACAQDQDEIVFTEQTDRIYPQHRGPTLIRDYAAKREFRVVAEGTRDTVVWNPWKERAAQIADLNPDDWQRFVCVEPGIVVEPVTLAPQHSYSMSQTLEYRSLS